MAKSTILTSDLSGEQITASGYQIRVVGPNLFSTLDVTENEAIEWAQKGKVSKKRGRKRTLDTPVETV